MDLEVPRFCTWKSPFTDQKVPFCGPGSPLYFEICTYRLVDLNLKLKDTPQSPARTRKSPTNQQNFISLTGSGPGSPFCSSSLCRERRTDPEVPLSRRKTFRPFQKKSKYFNWADNFRILVWLQNEKLHEWEGLPIPKRTYKSPFIFWGLSMAARLPQFAYAQTQH